MNTIYFDATASDDERRQRLYDGQIFVYSPRPGSRALCQLVRGLIESELGTIDPKLAESHLSAEDYLAVDAKVKQLFRDRPETQTLVQSLLADLGCDLDKTYFEIPQVRMVPQKGYLPGGEGLVHDPHRDTWYAAPMCQINWWIPVYEFESESAMAFHPHYWKQPVKNSSSQFNDLKTDLRELPDLEAIEIEPEIRVVCPVGGVILFSGAQMHSAVPNTSGYSRYSLDMRTVHHDEIVSNGGAANIDSYSTTALLKDFLNGAALKPLPEDIIAQQRKVCV